jgi:hypothetical protein
MRLVCPSCNAPVSAEDANLATGLAKCVVCQNIFRFDTAPELASSPDDAAPRRPDAPRPSSLTLQDRGGELTLVRRWFSPKIIFLTFFCVFWDGFLVFWYTMAFHGTTPLVAKLFPLIHVTAGIFITYAAVTGYVNSTTVRVGPRGLSVRHGPLPWPGNLTLNTSALKQLYCEERVQSTRNGRSYSYHLNAVLSDGSKKKLLSGLDSPDEPRYVEQQVEKWLKIRDEPVAGEFRG